VERGKGETGVTFRTVTVGFKYELLHCWPDAPESESWLRHPHLHEFRMVAEIEVEHNDREIEFFALRAEMEWERVRLFGTRGNETKPNLSCEMMAESMVDFLRKNYPGRNIEVSVWEDDLLSATVYWER